MRLFNIWRNLNQCFFKTLRLAEALYKLRQIHTMGHNPRKAQQYLEYGSLPQQTLRQVLPGQLSGGLQLLVPISGLETHEHIQLINTEINK